MLATLKFSFMWLEWFDNLFLKDKLLVAPLLVLYNLILMLCGLAAPNYMFFVASFIFATGILNFLLNIKKYNSS